MPIAAFIQINLFCVYFIFSTNSGNEVLIFSNGNLSPIVPVQPKSISFEEICFGASSSLFCISVNFEDKSKEIFFNASWPSGPVNALAFLVLTNNANIFFALIFLFHFRFSDINFDWVYTEA